MIKNNLKAIIMIALCGAAVFCLYFMLLMPQQLKLYIAQKNSKLFTQNYVKIYQKFQHDLVMQKKLSNLNKTYAVSLKKFLFNKREDIVRMLNAAVIKSQASLQSLKFIAPTQKNGKQFQPILIELSGTYKNLHLLIFRLSNNFLLTKYQLVKNKINYKIRCQLEAIIDDKCSSNGDKKSNIDMQDKLYGYKLTGVIFSREKRWAMILMPNHKIIKITQGDFFGENKFHVEAITLSGVKMSFGNEYSWLKIQDKK